MSSRCRTALPSPLRKTAISFCCLPKRTMILRNASLRVCDPSKGYAAALDLHFPRRYSVGEELAKMIDFTPEKPFTAEQLSEIRRNFSRLSTPSLQTAYTEALERCRLGRDGRPPKAEDIQVLVQAWRQLRKAK